MQQGARSIIGIILIVIGSLIIVFQIFDFIGVGLLQSDLQKEKERSIAVEGIVQKLRYDHIIQQM